MAVVLSMTWLLPMAASAASTEDAAAILYTKEGDVSFDDLSQAWNYAVGIAEKSGAEITMTLQKDWIAKNGVFGTNLRENAVLQFYSVTSDLIPAFENGRMMLDGNIHIVLDLNGHIIDRGLLTFEDGGGLFDVKGKSKLTIIDSEPTAVHRGMAMCGGILTGGASGDSAGCIALQDSAELVMQGGNVVGCMSQSNGGAIALGRRGGRPTLNIDGTKFYTNYAMDSADVCYGGAIYIGRGTVNIQNAVFEGNYSEDSGGAIYIKDGTNVISNCIFRANTAKDDGGAIYTDTSLYSLNVMNCVFMENTADASGGACYFNGSNGACLWNNIMKQNHCAEYGGAICVNADRVYLVGGTISENTADKNGGGVYVDSLYDVGVQGLLVVAQNHVGQQDNNLCLQDGLMSTARITNGGLYPESMVCLTSTTKSAVRAAKNISLSQTSQYIKVDNGTWELQNQHLQQERLVASVIGNGNLILVIIGAAFIAAAAVVMMIFGKRRKRHAKP